MRSRCMQMHSTLRAPNHSGPRCRATFQGLLLRASGDAMISQIVHIGPSMSYFCAAADTASTWSRDPHSSTEKPMIILSNEVPNNLLPSLTVICLSWPKFQTLRHHHPMASGEVIRRAYPNLHADRAM
ncbi:hypothetical protein FIBSPDRAFT_74678 [Athelia psychrophila]|uniref:Uncharacterized protein n=1 Tax=Athelia psychrophila TaxID=1759441 RepID=A0A167SX40_9AGAM|nr:hypothetical protein FIBSPDRAFT_74678 [Fibularhizoctonia sp. CBS 109695]